MRHHRERAVKEIYPVEVAAAVAAERVRARLLGRRRRRVGVAGSGPRDQRERRQTDEEGEQRRVANRRIGIILKMAAK
jgi:hypothetical protein